jgi:hypothetical protein
MGGILTLLVIISWLESALFWRRRCRRNGIPAPHPNFSEAPYSSCLWPLRGQWAFIIA